MLKMRREKYWSNGEDGNVAAALHHSIAPKKEGARRRSKEIGAPARGILAPQSKS
jgi:hypothetical protein